MKLKLIYFIPGLFIISFLSSCGKETSVGDKKPDFIMTLDSLGNMLSDPSKGGAFNGKIIQVSGRAAGVTSTRINNGAESSAKVMLQGNQSPFTLDCFFNESLQNEVLNKEVTIKGEFNWASADKYTLEKCAIVK